MFTDVSRPVAQSRRRSTARADGDVLRVQSPNGITVTTDDVAVASDHGEDLLAYVLSDLITPPRSHCGANPPVRRLGRPQWGGGNNGRLSSHHLKESLTP
jgi:hypothetical protein